MREVKWCRSAVVGTITSQISDACPSMEAIIRTPRSFDSRSATLSCMRGSTDSQNRISAS